MPDIAIAMVRKHVGDRAISSSEDARPYTAPAPRRVIDATGGAQHETAPRSLGRATKTLNVFVPTKEALREEWKCSGIFSTQYLSVPDPRAQATVDELIRLFAGAKYSARYGCGNDNCYLMFPRWNGGRVVSLYSARRRRRRDSIVLPRSTRPSPYRRLGPRFSQDFEGNVGEHRRGSRNVIVCTMVVGEYGGDHGCFAVMHTWYAQPL